MLRKTLCSLVALLLVATVALAAEYKGTVKKINAKNGDMTLTVKDGDNDKDKDFTIPPLAKIVDGDGKELKGKKRLATISSGTSLTVTTEKKKVGDEEKEVITQVKVNK
jgi:hypothetical protein